MNSLRTKQGRLFPSAHIVSESTNSVEKKRTFFDSQQQNETDKRQRSSTSTYLFGAFISEHIEQIIGKDLFEKIESVFNNIASELNIDGPISPIAEQLMFSAISRNTSLRAIRFMKNAITPNNLNAFKHCVHEHLNLGTLPISIENEQVILETETRISFSDIQSFKLSIYTDGACKENNQRDSSIRKCGYGVWFGHEHPRNIGLPFPLENPSNNRAELYAILAALNAIRTQTDQQNVEILTDSQYSIDCMVKWMSGWKRNQWKLTNHKPVKNQDILKPIDAKLSSLLSDHDIKVSFSYVKGHSGIPGNEGADRLANQGCI